MYCFRCGCSYTAVQGAVLPLCPDCAAGAPGGDAELRYLVRPAKGRTQGPMDHERIVEQFGRGAIGTLDDVARVGGRWYRLTEHPDFRSVFLPGNERVATMEGEHRKEAAKWKWIDLRKRARLLRAVVLALCSVGLAVWSAQRDILVVPDAWIERVSGWFTSVREEAEDNFTVSSEITAEDIYAELPGNDWVADLQALHPDVDHSSYFLLQQGRALLWREGEDEARQARLLLEQAVASAPVDVEALTALAQAYTNLLDSEPELRDTVEMLLDRARFLAPESTAWRRASAVLAVVDGDAERVVELARPCGFPIENAGLPDSGVDLGCAVSLALVQGGPDELAILGERYPEVFSVQLLWSIADVGAGNFERALGIARRMTTRWPDSRWPLRIETSIARSLGDWDRVLALGEHLPENDSAFVLDHARRAEVLLKTSETADPGNEAYRSLLEHPAYQELVSNADVLADAATAAYYSSDGGANLDELRRAGRLSGLALRAAAGHPAASLIRAQVDLHEGNPDAAVGVLVEAVPETLDPYNFSRYAVASSFLYVAAERHDLAIEILEDATYRGNITHDLLRAESWAQISAGNPIAALDALDKLPFVSPEEGYSRSPIQPIWYPRPTWGPLLEQVEEAIVTRLTLADRELLTLGALLWSMDIAEGAAKLGRDAVASAEPTASSAALAQDAVDAGRAQEALTRAREAQGLREGEALMKAIEGWARCSIGDTTGARDAFRTARSGATQSSAIHRLELECYLRVEDDTAALTVVDRWLQYESDNIQALQARVELLALDR